MANIKIEYKKTGSCYIVAYADTLKSTTLKTIINQFKVYHYENKEYIFKYSINYYTTKINLLISSVLKYLYKYSFDNMIINNINTLIVSYDYKPPFYGFKFNNKLSKGFNYEI